MDILFLDHLQVYVTPIGMSEARIQPSREESLRAILAMAGLELIDYGNWTERPSLTPGLTTVDVYSRQFRENAERAAARR